MLAQNGYIHKIKAKGSFVLDMGRMDFPMGDWSVSRKCLNGLGVHHEQLYMKII